MEWEKTSENYMFDERVISKIYKELLQINSKNTKNLIKITNTQWAKELNRYFPPAPKKRNTNGQQVYEKVVIITNQQVNANQNHNDISSYTCHDSYYQQTKLVLGRMWRSWKPCTLSLTVQNGTLAMGTSRDVPQKIKKNKTTL